MYPFLEKNFYETWWLPRRTLHPPPNSQAINCMITTLTFVEKTIGVVESNHKVGGNKGSLSVQVKSVENFEMTHGRGLPLDTYVLGAH